MSAFAPVSLKNEAGTEVVFNPTTVERNNNVNVANYATSAPVYDAKSRLSISLQLPSSKSNRTKIMAKLLVPLMDSVNPALKINEDLVKVEFSLAKESPLINRQDLRAYVADLLTDAIVKAMVENQEGVY